MTGKAECLVAGGTECFVGTFWVVLSASCHPNLPCAPLHSCKWGDAAPMNIFLQLV